MNQGMVRALIRSHRRISQTRLSFALLLARWLIVFAMWVSVLAARGAQARIPVIAVASLASVYVALLSWRSSDLHGWLETNWIPWVAADTIWLLVLVYLAGPTGSSPAYLLLALPAFTAALYVKRRIRSVSLLVTALVVVSYTVLSLTAARAASLFTTLADRSALIVVVGILGGLVGVLGRSHDSFYSLYGKVVRGAPTSSRLPEPAAALGEAVHELESLLRPLSPTDAHRLRLLLTARQQEVLRLRVLEHLNSKQIAARLENLRRPGEPVSKSTVDGCLKEIRDRTGLESDTQLALFAWRTGVVSTAEMTRTVQQVEDDAWKRT